MNFYKRFVGDYARKTMGLSQREHGAYNLLLDAYYATETPLPNDPNELYLIGRAGDEEGRQAVDRVLRRFWLLTDNGYINRRADEEIADYAILTERQRQNGRKGGRPINAMRGRDPNVLPGTKPTGFEVGSERVESGKPRRNPAIARYQNKEESKANRAPAAPLPDWVPQAEWDAYLDSRRRTRHPMTDHAAALAVRKLDELRQAGNDPKAVLEQSILHAWVGLFPLRELDRNSRAERAIASFLARTEADDVKH